MSVRWLLGTLSGGRIKGKHHSPQANSHMDSNTHHHRSSTTQQLVIHKKPKTVVRQLLAEMKSNGLESIRFASYRVACKLRFIQKKTNIYLVSIWDVIETLREHGLGDDCTSKTINLSRLSDIILGLCTTVDRQLSSVQQTSSGSGQGGSLLLGFLQAAYDSHQHGKVNVIAIKIALSTLSSGKLDEKLKYICAEVQDTNGLISKERFEEFLRHILALCSVLREGQAFGYNSSSSQDFFKGRDKLNAREFLRAVTAEPGLPALMWLPILGRLALVENVFHPVKCEVCRRDSFIGFRYKCQTCDNYQLCQDCFWRGKTSGSHSNSHEVKEYTSYKLAAPTGSKEGDDRRSAAGKSSSSRPTKRRTLESSPAKSKLAADPSKSPTFRRKPLALSHRQATLESGRIDDEHQLIARFAHKLAAKVSASPQTSSDGLMMNVRSMTPHLPRGLGASEAQKEMIGKLEEKNRQILQEIHRLKMEQEAAAGQMMNFHGNIGSSTQPPEDPSVLMELQVLRSRKLELAKRMHGLQQNRAQLMTQLDRLMKLLKTHSSRSTPVTSPKPWTHPPMYSGSSTPGRLTPSHSVVESEPSRAPRSTTSTPISSTSGGNNVNLSTLFNAADSITDAMTNLVKTVSESSLSDDSDEDDRRGRPTIRKKQRDRDRDRMLGLSAADAPVPAPRPRQPPPVRTVSLDRNTPSTRVNSITADTPVAYTGPCFDVDDETTWPYILNLDAGQHMGGKAVDFSVNSIDRRASSRVKPVVVNSISTEEQDEHEEMEENQYFSDTEAYERAKRTV